MDDHLIEFYGTECVHCREMEPLFEKLKDETGLEIKRLEMWHNEGNAELFQKYDQGKCGGVPFLINLKTGKWLCGSATYEKLKEWAMGK